MSSLRLALKLSLDESKNPDGTEIKKQQQKTPQSKAQKRKRNESGAESDESQKTKRASSRSSTDRLSDVNEDLESIYSEKIEPSDTDERDLGQLSQHTEQSTRADNESRRSDEIQRTPRTHKAQKDDETPSKRKSNPNHSKNEIPEDNDQKPDLSKVKKNDKKLSDKNASVKSSTLKTDSVEKQTSKKIAIVEAAFDRGQKQEPSSSGEKGLDNSSKNAPDQEMEAAQLNSNRVSRTTNSPSFPQIVADSIVEECISTALSCTDPSPVQDEVQHPVEPQVEIQRAHLPQQDPQGPINGHIAPPLIELGHSGTVGLEEEGSGTEPMVVIGDCQSAEAIEATNDIVPDGAVQNEEKSNGNGEGIGRREEEEELNRKEVIGQGDTLKEIDPEGSLSAKAYDGEDEDGEKRMSGGKGGSARKSGVKRKRKGVDVNEGDEVGAPGVESGAVVKTEEEAGEEASHASVSARAPSRAAAMAAKTKMSGGVSGKTAVAVQPVPSTKPSAADTQKDKVKSEKTIDAVVVESDVGHVVDDSTTAAPLTASAPVKSHWVACDLCGKWRCLPGDTNVTALPEKWYCTMNTLDPLHDDCSKEEEDYKDVDGDETIDSVAPLQSRDSADGAVGRRGGSRGRGGRAGGRRGRRNFRAGDHEPSRSSQSTQVVEAQSRAHESDEDDRDGGGGYMGTRRRKGKSYATQNDDDDLLMPNPISETSAVVERVVWVQCNKCSKWRKVPGRINQKELPDVWYCVLNTWAPEYARCAAKEEEEEPIASQGSSRFGDRGGGVGRGRYPRKTRPVDYLDSADQAPANDGAPVKKITQWVQCERKNCKKWRKIPGQVDLSSLPEKWYCEMNVWDPERATCDGAEETDSEGEQPVNAVTRTQLILGNSKGPGTLSYRRLIFGTDGRVRPFYSEKNKNGYGIFSYTEVFRPSETDEYITPTRRVGYWWSSAYDEAGANFSTSSKGHRVDKKSSLATVDSLSFPFPTAAVKVPSSRTRPPEAHHLLDCIQRLSGKATAAPPPSGKWSKIYQASKKQTLFSRVASACSVVKSCLSVLPAEGSTLEDIYRAVCSAHFIAPDLETTRSTLGLGELKEIMYRLEQMGDVEVTYDNNGCLSFKFLLQFLEEKTSTNRYPEILCSGEGVMQGKSYPLVMRKRKMRADVYT